MACHCDEMTPPDNLNCVLLLPCINEKLSLVQNTQNCMFISFPPSLVVVLAKKLTCDRVAVDFMRKRERVGTEGAAVPYSLLS